LIDIAGQRLSDLARLSARCSGLLIRSRSRWPVCSLALRSCLRNDAIVLELPRDLAPLASERLANRVRALGKLLDREAVIQVGSAAKRTAA
jgi:exopolyphosphatase/guanosine-5'-triphosphate,3'-diphosphate pyrophosphatase